MAPSSLTPLLLISGPIGVGKSTVAGEVSDQLAEQAISHTFIDFDQLRYTYPRPADDRFGSQLACLHLRDIWRNCFGTGSRNLIISSVIETQEDVNAIQQVIPSSTVTVCQLRATLATLRARVQKREMGQGLAWHLQRTAELVEILAGEVPKDFEIATDDRTVGEIAAEIVGQVNWI
ncbi:MAG: AAA family ATPase [Cyanobacteria bacterium J06632_22]